MEIIFIGVLVFVFTVLKFIGLESSPPGFYVDEAAGAAHVVCLHQTGQDFFGHSFPLFTQGLGGGYYTAPYLYGEWIWTSIFGISVYSFRAFMAFVTTGTILFLWDWLRKRVDLKTACFAALFASVIPWSFQFARIAWDPPLAPLFLMMGLWALDLKKSYAWILGGLAFALAAYSYPPSRIQVLILLCVLPGFSWKQKGKIAFVFLVANIPMIYQTVTDPYFTARGKMLALTSSYPGNPYKDADIFGLAFGFIAQFFAHFSPRFWLLSGDTNLRHSIQTVGEVDWAETLILVSGILYFVVASVVKRVISINGLIVFAVIGVASGIAPAALTWESVPHSLRAIGAWPFLVILSALTFHTLIQKIKSVSSRASRIVEIGAMVITLGFGIFYLNGYFTEYPSLADAWFKDDNSPLGSAYRQMTESQVFCSDLRKAYSK